jgi:hypothetical protein
LTQFNTSAVASILVETLAPRERDNIGEAQLEQYYKDISLQSGISAITFSTSTLI